MGIPSYFRTILENYPNVIYANSKKKTDYFLIDFNSIIYNQIPKVDIPKNGNKTKIQIENLIIKYTIAYLKHAICDFVKPQKMIYFAFDGVAPRAKMTQQRWRRFKTININKFDDYLQNKYNLPKKVNFGSKDVSPGTKFMEKMSKQLQKAIKSGSFSTHTKNKLEYILSDSSIPGEGEHKYMNIIKNVTNKKENITVFSPDADVIVLSVSSNVNNIRILKTPQSEIEREHYPTQEFIYLDIDKFKKILFSGILEVNSSFDMNKIFIDYTFLTILEGNDFVIAVPYLKMIKDQMRTLMKTYRKILNKNKEYLIIVQKEKVSINRKFFIELLDEISKNEEKMLKNIQKRMHRIRKNRPPRRFEKEKDKEQHEIEKCRFEHEEYYSEYNPEYQKYNKIFNKVNYFNENWKCDYYGHFLEIDCHNDKEYDMYLRKVCHNYIEALIFNMEYYLFTSPAWRWHYRFRCAPCISDLLQYIKSVPTALDINLDKSTPYTPLQQLFMILPPQSKSYLPKKYGELMTNVDSPLIQYFPIDFELDVLAGEKFIYSEPILPELNDTKILNELVKIKLTKTEERRNTLNKEPIVIVN